jgi:cytochrome c-type biogenesis protein CcmH/NrfG
MGNYSPHEEEQEATQDEIRSVAMTAAFLIVVILAVVSVLATAIWGIMRLF